MVDEAPNMNGKGKPMPGEYGVGVSDVGILAGLYGGIDGGGRGRRGGYGEYGEHKYDGTAIKSLLNSAEHDRVVGAITSADDFRSLSNQINVGDSNLRDRIDSESLSRNFADITAELSRQSLAAAECCCELRVANARQDAQLTQILANQVQDRNDAQHNDLRNRIDDIDHRRH